MQTLHLPESQRIAPDESPRGPFAGDIMDLFVAMMVVVPVAWILKSLL